MQSARRSVGDDPILLEVPSANLDCGLDALHWCAERNFRVLVHEEELPGAFKPNEFLGVFAFFLMAGPPKLSNKAFSFSSLLNVTFASD